MSKRNPSKADPFDVWGKPPSIILDQLGRNDHNRLRSYIERVASKTYRLAYDLGARAERGRSAACVPTTWLDPLLSGPKKVADFPDCAAVERLLGAIRDRIHNRPAPIAGQQTEDKK